MVRLFWAWLLDWNFGPPEVKVSKWRIGWAAKLYIDHSLYNELQNSNFIQAINVKRNKILEFFRNFSDFQKFSRLFSVITTTTVLSHRRSESSACSKRTFSGFVCLWCSERFLARDAEKFSIWNSNDVGDITYIWQCHWNLSLKT